MTQFDLSEQLAQLRTPPPDNGFELRLHNALLREANVMAVSTATGTPGIPRWRRGGFRLRVALGVLIALTGSAAAMWATDYVQSRAKARDGIGAASPLGTPTEVPVVRVHRVRLPAAAATANAVVAPSAVPPVDLPTLVPKDAPKQESEAYVNETTARHQAVDQRERQPLGTRLTPPATIAQRSFALDRVEIPESSGSTSGASGQVEQRPPGAQLRSRPSIEIADIPEVAENARKDRDAVSHGRGAEQREKTASDARQLRRENAERGLERAREARQKHNK